MRFKFEGRWEAQALAGKIEQALVSFCDQYGIKSLAGVNLYFNMYDEANNELEINAPDGQTMAGLAFKNPNLPKRVSKKKTESGTIVPFQPRDSTPEIR